MDVPTEVFPWFFRIRIAMDAFLDFSYGKGGTGKRVGKILVILEVHIIDELIA
jgi:hypothetical protein